MKKFVKLLKETAQAWQKDQALKEGAALAFYTILSLPAFLLLLVSSAGIFIDTPQAAAQLSAVTAQYVGPIANQEIATILQTVPEIGFGSIGAVVSVLVLIWSASSIAGNLQRALNTIWNIVPASQGWKAAVKNRLRLLLMILVVSVLFLGIIFLQTLLPAVLNWLGNPLAQAPLVLAPLRWVGGLVILIAVFAGIYKFVPQAKVGWCEAMVGGAATAVLFTLGNAVISWYVGRSNLNLYGSAGSLMALLLWVYYSSIIIFVGAEFTQIFAHLHGRTIVGTNLPRLRRWQQWFKNL